MAWLRIGYFEDFGDERTFDQLPQLLAYYAGETPIIQPYVHPQLRAVLKRFDK